MAAPLVDRATSDMLIGADWAMNNEICEIINRDPGQAKDVVKGLKRRLRSKKPKVQLLALCLLESIVKSCGDVVHMQVADRGILNEMVKMVKKKPDFRVKEKILVLLDTWQESFGGARARHPQYFAAYQDLLLAGAVFPQRSDRSSFTPGSISANAATSYSQQGNNRQEESESSAGIDLPVLSLAEVENARGIMDVLSEMLNALDPANKEGLKQEVITDLVEQCRRNKQRIVHLVNTTSDEELLRLGLALNDDLQRVLAKHDAIAAGFLIREEKPKPPPALVDIGDEKAQDIPSNSNESSSTGTATQSVFNQLLLTGPPSMNEKGTSAAPAKVEPQVDLLSWDDVSTPAASDTLALVPVQQPSVSTPASDQNSLVLFDMFSQGGSNATNTNPSPAQISTSVGEQQMPQPTFLSNGGTPGSSSVFSGQGNYSQVPLPNGANSMWNNQMLPNSIAQHQQLNQTPSVDGADPANTNGVFPLPPWEVQQSSLDGHVGLQQPQDLHGSQETGMYTQMMQHPQGSQETGMYTQMMQHTQGSQETGMYTQMMQHPQASQEPGMYTQMMQNPQAPQVMQNPQFYPQTLQSTQLSGFTTPMQSGQLPGMNPYSTTGGMVPGMHLQQPFASGQISGGMPFQEPVAGGGMHMLTPMQANQMGAYYAYSQQQEFQYVDQRTGYPIVNPTDLSQRMYRLAMQDRINQTNTASPAVSSLSQPMRAPKQEDKFFGDLVNFAKSKPNKPSMSQVGGL